MKNDGCSIKNAVIKVELCCDFAKKLHGEDFPDVYSALSL